MTSLTTFSTKIDVAAASMAELVTFYNSLSGKSAIKKFETRAKGVERCTALLKIEGAPTPKGIDPTTAPKATVTKVANAEPSTRKAERKPSVGITVKRAPSAMEQLAKTVVAKAAPTPRKPKAASGAPTKPGRGRALFTADGVITVKHKGENPKRAEAATRFDLYRTGMTVAAYIEAGGQRRDVVWDMAQGWITVKG